MLAGTREGGWAAGGSSGSYVASVQPVVAPGADSKVADFLKYLVNNGILQFKVVNNRVKAA